MSIKIGSNIASLVTQRYLDKHNQKIESVFERLSSGQRINRASDDAAGLAVATSLKASVRLYTQAHRNINDGISALAIAQGGLQSLTDIVIRIKELAEQSSSGTFSSTQRTSLDAEAQALVSEYQRIGQTVKFNGRTLLNGDFQNVGIQAGITNQETITLSIQNVLGVETTVSSGVYDGPDLYNAGANPREIIQSDLNEDGILDLIMRGSNYVQIYTGNSDGTFKASLSLGCPSASSITLGDFNHDGNVDIYTTTTTAGHDSSLWYGNGNGSFKARAGLNHNLNGHVVATDINEDGWDDLVLLRDFGNYDERFQIFVNNQSGGFTDMGSLGGEPESNPSNLTTGDFNNDGNTDLLYTYNENPYTTPNRIGVKLGNGDGTFKYVSSYRVGTDPQGVTFADLNGDSIMDIVTANENTNNVSVLFGNSNGTFKSPINYTTGSAPNSVEILDINGDSVLDLLVSEGTSNSISVLYGNSGGTFKAPVSLVGSAAPSDLIIGDYNRDGINDFGYINNTTTQMEVMLSGSTVASTAFNVSLLTQSSSRSALDLTETTLQNLSTQLGKIGAQLSRLEIASRNVLTLRENYSASYSRIMDADVALESAELIKSRILQQFAVNVLGHTNQDTEIVLSLLR